MESQVYIDVRRGGGNRQIGPASAVLEGLNKRKHDIEAAIQAGVEIATEAASKSTEKASWRISQLEMTFGIALQAEAGAILSKVGGEASIEVKIIVEHKSATTNA